ncbi:unnamed protein product [Boreogadus saida]
MWIDANQARILIGFEEDILIVSEGKMAPFTHDFRKAQQRMPAIPVNIHYVNFTWQATDQDLPPRIKGSRRLCRHVPNIWPICALKTLVEFSNACQQQCFIGGGGEFP